MPTYVSPNINSILLCPSKWSPNIDSMVLCPPTWTPHQCRVRILTLFPTHLESEYWLYSPPMWSQNIDFIPHPCGVRILTVFPTHLEFALAMYWIYHGNLKKSFFTWPRRCSRVAGTPLPKRTSPPLVAVADDPKIMLPWLCQSISVYIILYPIGQLFSLYLAYSNLFQPSTQTVHILKEFQSCFCRLSARTFGACIGRGSRRAASSGRTSLWWCRIGTTTTPRTKTVQRWSMLSVLRIWTNFVRTQVSGSLISKCFFILKFLIFFWNNKFFLYSS